MEISELKTQCCKILLDGNISITEDGILSFDIENEEKLVFIEYAVNMILYDMIQNMKDTSFLDKIVEE